MLVTRSRSVPDLANYPDRPEHVIRLDARGTLQDTVSALVGRAGAIGLGSPSGGGFTFTLLPESYRSLFAPSADGSGFVVVHREAAGSAEPHTFRVIRFGARTDTAWARDIPYTPIPVSSEWRSRNLDEKRLPMNKLFAYLFPVLACGVSRSEIAAGDRTGGSRHTASSRRSMALMPAALACFCAASPLPASGQLERWTLERTVTIGDAFDQETGLTLVGDVIVVGDRLLVAQPWERRIRVYSVAGDFLGFIGRSGEGPGEFRSLDGMGLHDGLVWTHDSGLQRLQYFDAEGRFVSSVRIRVHPALGASAASVWGILPDGSKLVRYSASADEFAQSPLKREALLLFDPAGLPRDTVAMIVGLSSVVQLTDGRESGWASYASLPESYRSLLSVAPDGSGFVVVHRTGATGAEPHTFHVIRFDARADTAWAHEIPYDPIRVPGAWRVAAHGGGCPRHRGPPRC